MWYLEPVKLPASYVAAARCGTPLSHVIAQASDGKYALFALTEGRWKKLSVSDNPLDFDDQIWRKKK